MQRCLTDILKYYENNKDVRANAQKKEVIRK